MRSEVPAGAGTEPKKDGKPIDVTALTEEVKVTSAFLDDVFLQVGKVVVGQREMVERVMIGLLTGGHCLIEGVPGLAKTLTVRTLAQTINASFSRIQFTPDLMPADITGTIIYNMHTGQFTQKRGPLFANLVLADEVNRAPAKVQSALLEAMQERQVTIGDSTHPLPDPFLVLATQNPIEQEGTYPLPEAQLDRFLFKVTIGYPTRDDERDIVRRHGHRTTMPRLSEFQMQPIADLGTLVGMRNAISQIRLSDAILDYIVDLVRATRERPSIAFGASPRAATMLCTASRAYAALQGRDFVLPDDVKNLAVPALRHRVVLAPGAEIEGLTAESVVRQILEQVPVPR
jgi:MoxR-like ATPase